MTHRIKPKLTRKRLLELFRYDRKEGKLFWKNPTSNRVKPGRPAGNVFRSHGIDYMQVRVETQNYQTHRLIWLIEFGKFPKYQIDHIDGDGLNNRIKNLRDVTVQEQAKNLSRRATNTSGVTGVTWNRNIRMWVAQISADKQALYLGKYDLFADAVAARKKAEKKFGFHRNHDRPSIR